MAKTLVFSDAHRAGKNAYKSLLREAIDKNIKSIVFLGDVDGCENYHHLMDFRDYARQSGIEFVAVRGNHDQAWKDYAEGLEERCVANREKDPSIRKDSEVKDFLSDMGKAHVNQAPVLYCHALPRGKRHSGPDGSKKIKGDHRFKYRDLWQYSFGTDNTQSGFVGNILKFFGCTDINAYDPDVIRWNFTDRMLGAGIQFMLKGHEHVPKIWNYDTYTKRVSGGKKEKPGTKRTVQGPAIIQVGAFENGHYAVVEYSPKGMNVEFARLRKDQM